MGKVICPFSKEECEDFKCQLWDIEKGQCVFTLIALNLEKLRNVIDTVIDKLVYKH